MSIDLTLYIGFNPFNLIFVQGPENPTIGLKKAFYKILNIKEVIIDF